MVKKMCMCRLSSMVDFRRQSLDSLHDVRALSIIDSLRLSLAIAYDVLLIYIYRATRAQLNINVLPPSLDLVGTMTDFSKHRDLSMSDANMCQPTRHVRIL